MSKQSLYDLLCDVMDWGSSNTQKGISPEKAKQAIVEAVEGIYGDSDGLREFASTPTNQVVNPNVNKRKEP